MSYDRLWGRLVSHLDGMGRAREVARGIEVTFASDDGEPRTVELVITPEDWDDYVSITYGDGDPARTDVRSLVRSNPPDCCYLVYDGCYDFIPSPTRSLPPDPESTYRPPPDGFWAVHDDDGRVIDRFRAATDDG